MNTALSSRVQVALDDAAAGEAVLALSSALARALEGELAVAYVESRAAVSAAALPATQVLPHAGSPWLPLRPDDVEQGFRSHAARLRQLTERAAARHALRWSMQVMRGSLADAANLLGGESPLLFLASAPPPGPATARGRRQPLVALSSEPGCNAPEALAVATRLARTVGGALQSWPPASAIAGWPGVAADTRPDVLVMARRFIAPAALGELRCPLLLVG